MTYQLKIELEGVGEPRVWRRLVISPEMTLYHLHRAIQAAMGWSDKHPHCFCAKAADGDMEVIPTCDEQGRALETRIKRHINHDNPQLQYIYDFGDYWLHTITLEHARMDVTAIPECIAGEGSCPPEDCGGPTGYQELKVADRSDAMPPFAVERANAAIIETFLPDVIGQ